MLSEMPTGPVRPQEWRQSPDRDQARRISGPDAGGAGNGKVITANGGGNTELSTSGCEFSSTDGIRTNDVLFPWGRGVVPPRCTGCLLPVKFPAAPVLLADGPQLGSWQVAVVWVDETHVGDISGQKCPRAEEMLTSTEVTGVVIPVVLAGGSPLAGTVNPAGPDGPVVAGGPIGPCETPSPSSCGTLEPLEHSVQIHADPAGQHAAVGTLSPSDCYPAGPAGPYVAGGPVGPDVSFTILEPI